MASTISSLPVALPVIKASHKPSHAKPSSPKTLPAKPAALPKQITDCRKSNISYKLAFSGPAPCPQSPPPCPSKSPITENQTSVTNLHSVGLHPERINGRLAMVGFVLVIGVELVKGDGLMAQLANGGLPWFFYTTVLLSVAFWNTFEAKFSPRHI